MKWWQFILLTLSCWGVCFVASRTYQVANQPVIPEEFDAAAIGLEGKRVDWDIAKAPLESVIQQMRERYGASIEIDYDDVGRQREFFPEDFRPTTPAQLRLRGATLAEAIWGIARVNEDPDNPITQLELDFAVVGSTVVINRLNHDARYAVVRAYDIKPLLARLRPHQEKLAELIPERERKTLSGGLFERSEPASVDYDLANAVEELIYELATDGAIVEDRFPTMRAAGIVFAQARPDQHQRIVRRLNGLNAALDALESERK